MRKRSIRSAITTQRDTLWVGIERSRRTILGACAVRWQHMHQRYIALALAERSASSMEMQAPATDPRFTRIARLQPEALDQFTLEQRQQYDLAFTRYHAALAEHRHALILYRHARQTGTPFCFWYEFDIRAAYRDLYEATYPSVSNGVAGAACVPAVLQPATLWATLSLLVAVLVLALALPA
jgi:hypothetical protein